MRTIGQITQKLSYEEAKLTAGTRREQVLQYIKANPGCTRREVSNNLGLLINSVTARVKELLDKGTIVEVGTTECSVTGKLVATLSVAATSSALSA